MLGRKRRQRKQAKKAQEQLGIVHEQTVKEYNKQRQFSKDMEKMRKDYWYVLNTSTRDSSFLEALADPSLFSLAKHMTNRSKIVVIYQRDRIVE